MAERSELTLYCCIRGEANVFGVKVQADATVDDLKKCIKKEAQLDSEIPIKSLQLYQVSGFQSPLAHFTLGGMQSLMAHQKLSTLFPTQNAGSILDIIVDAPILSVVCWLQGDVPHQKVVIEVPAAKNVQFLKEKVKEAYPPAFRNTAVYLIKLYKVVLPTRGLAESLNSLEYDEPLDGSAELSAVFKDVPLADHLHIVIEAPSRLGKHALEEADTGLDKAKRLKLATTAPSTIATLLEYMKMQENPNERLLDDRRIIRGHQPDAAIQDADVAPISLLYEGFGQFLDIFRGRNDVPGIENVSSSEIRSAVDTFAEQMSFVYLNEEDRMHAGLRALDTILSARTDNNGPPPLMAATVSNKSRSDGHILGRHRIIYCVNEFKNEAIHTNAIPYVELAGYFAHSINQALPSSDAVVLGWRVPCLGMTIIGPCVTFYAIIFLDQYRIVSLTPGLSCVRASGDGDDRKALYAAFTAASVLLARIAADVNRLVINHPPPIRNDRFFPAISRLPHPTSQTHIQFQIINFYPDRQPYRHLYIARATDGKNILIKFTRSYSPELHMFCAERGHAPTLFGFQRLPGGFFAVAMEWDSSAVPLSYSPYVHKHKEWTEQLQGLAESFHAEGLVHGDLRSPNIICNENRVMLIDFDWGGKMGEVSYPNVELNPELIEGRGSTNLIITRDDDLRVLRKTLGKLPLA